LRKNVETYVASDNIHMREQYDRIRVNLGELIRALIELRKIDDAELVRERVETLKEKARADDAVANGTLDRLIRDDLITATMASSLMNDTNYAAEMYDLIIKASGILYSLTRSFREEMTDLPDDAGEMSAEERMRIAEMLRKSQRDIDEAIEKARPTR
ncbi:MAG: hypothetical protein OES37_07065, partial [Chromatiales bacterium]|nr:hypothetical protein [Chromatiales bacterium]